jgi:thioredoxin-related protein
LITILYIYFAVSGRNRTKTPYMRILAFIVLAFFAFIRYAPAQELLHDPNTAFSTATTTGKDILLIFSGSDWCIPCIRFEKKILTDSAFRLFASANLILLEADFPQRKKIPDSLRTAYETLAAKFNSEGEFPHLVLLGPERHLLGTVPAADQSAAEFITTIKSFLPPREK